MTPPSHDTFAAFMGLDWADAQHEGCRQAAGTAKRESLQLAPTPAAMDAWGTTLRTRFHGQPVAVCLARDQGPLVSAWRTEDLLGLCPLQPLTLARYRAACTPRRAQDDPTDAALPLALLLPHRDKRPPLSPQSATLRARTQRGAPRRRVVGDTVRMTHRLTRTRKHSGPHVLHWFQAKDPPSFCAFLRRWPTLTAVPLARRSTLERLCRDPHGRSPEVIARRLQAISAALPLTTAAGGIAPHALLVQALVAHLRVTLQAITACDTALAQRAQSPPDCPLCQALPGAGPVCASRLFGAFGEQRARDPSATALQQ